MQWVHFQRSAKRSWQVCSEEAEKSEYLYNQVDDILCHEIKSGNLETVQNIKADLIFDEM